MRLPVRVKGRDSRGLVFDEETYSENLCRNGAAFVTRFDVPIGCDLQIQIPPAHHAAMHSNVDFFSQGRVVHVGETSPEGERLIGLQFTGPRFQRLFRSESVA